MFTPRRIQLDQQMLPDPNAWGSGYAGKGYTQAELQDAVRRVGESRANRKERGERTREYTTNQAGRIVFARGHDWICNSRGSDRDVLVRTGDGRAVPPELQELFSIQGFVLDTQGRPCNPNGNHLFEHPDLALHTGLGHGSFWGERISYNVVPCRGEQFGFGRRDDGSPQVFGGYVRPRNIGISRRAWQEGDRRITREAVAVAATDHLVKTHGMLLAHEAPADIVFASRPFSVRHTWHSWNALFTVVVDVPEGVQGIGIEWATIEELPPVAAGMLGPHQDSMKAAVRHVTNRG